MGKLRNVFTAARNRLSLIFSPGVSLNYAPSAHAVLSEEAGDYTEETATTLAPVLGGIHLIARTAAASSWTIERYNAMSDSWVPVRMPGWPDWAKPDVGPHPTQTLPVAIETWILSRLIGSNSYVIPTITLGGIPSEWFVPPSGSVYAFETGDYRNAVKYTYSGSLLEQARNGKPPVTGELLHTPTLLIGSQLIGTSAFARAAPSFRAGIKADAHAEHVHATGGMQPSILSSSQEWNASDQFDVFNEQLSRHLQDPSKRGAPFISAGDLRSVSLHTTPQDSQLIDARSLTWSAASSILTLPPTLAGAPNVTTWGSGTRAQMDLFRAFTISGHVRALDDAFSRLLPRGWRFRLTPEHLQWQADPLGAARFVTRLEGRILTQNEARQVVGFPRLEDERADTVDFTETEEIPIADNGGDSDSGRDDGSKNINDDMEAILITEKQATFTSELQSLTANEVDVDNDMTIQGTAIIYGELGRPTNGLGEQMPMIIEEGAIDAEHLDDVFLLVQHDRWRMIARGKTGDVSVDLEDNKATWQAKLDMKDPEAVSVYRKVKRGTFSSCSMGYRIVESEEATDNVTGEDVTLVRKIRLDEISVVPDGAFPSSDSAVSASELEGSREVFTAQEISERFTIKVAGDDASTQDTKATADGPASVVTGKKDNTDAIHELREWLYPKEVF